MPNKENVYFPLQCKKCYTIIPSPYAITWEYLQTPEFTYCQKCRASHLEKERHQHNMPENLICQTFQHILTADHANFLTFTNKRWNSYEIKDLKKKQWRTTQRQKTACSTSEWNRMLAKRKRALISQEKERLAKFNKFSSGLMLSPRKALKASSHYHLPTQATPPKKLHRKQLQYIATPPLLPLHSSELFTSSMPFLITY